MRRTLWILALAASLAVVGTSQTDAGEITHLPGGMKCPDLLNTGQRVCIFTLEIKGPINAKMVSGVERLIDYRSGFSDPIAGTVVLLNSPGGDVNSAYEIGRLIHQQKYPVAIEAGSPRRMLK